MIKFIVIVFCLILSLSLNSVSAKTPEYFNGDLVYLKKFQNQKDCQGFIYGKKTTTSLYETNQTHSYWTQIKCKQQSAVVHAWIDSSIISKLVKSKAQGLDDEYIFSEL